MKRHKCDCSECREHDWLGKLVFWGAFTLVALIVAVIFGYCFPGWPTTVMGFAGAGGLIRVAVLL